MGELIDLSGKTFNFLTVLARIPRAKPGDSGWLCRCVCGTELKVQSFRLRSGRIKSCGCKRHQLSAAGNVSHGHWVGGKPSPEWTSWHSALHRCHNPDSTSYPRYGAKGITMCPEWRESFEAFYKELGPRPTGCTLDRIDSSRGYEPGNCKWSTPKQQSNHLKNNRYVIADGKRLTIREAADHYSLPYQTFRTALYSRGRYLAGEVLITLIPA